MIPASINLKLLFIISLVLTFLVLIALQISGEYLVTENTPLGILSFEFAGDLSTAKIMVDSWGDQGRIYAGLNLGLDYLFLLVYSLTLFSGSTLLAARIKLKSERVGRIGFAIAMGCLVAGGLDAIENYALIKILIEEGNDFYAGLAQWCAIPKFVLVVLGIIYIVSGSLFLLIARK